MSAGLWIKKKSACLTTRRFQNPLGYVEKRLLTNTRSSFSLFPKVMAGSAIMWKRVINQFTYSFTIGSISSMRNSLVPNLSNPFGIFERAASKVS